MVFVLDINRKPLSPCHEAVARKLLKQGKAAIFKRYPFTGKLSRKPTTLVVGMKACLDPK